MKLNTKIRNIVLGCCVMAAGLLMDAPLPGVTTVNDAEARIGRPLTPGSVAGVARRTTRRTIRRSTIYRSTLPAGCSTVVISGASCYQCGTTYYQAHGSQYVVVYVD